MELNELARRLGGIDTKIAFTLAMRDRYARKHLKKSLKGEGVGVSIDDLDEAGLAKSFDEVDAIENAFLDTATFHSKIVWQSHTYDPNDPDDEDHHYPVQLRCFGGVYYVFALELDNAGFFPSADSAIKYIACAHPYLAHSPAIESYESSIGERDSEV